MEQNLIDELISSLKMINYKNPNFDIPQKGFYDSLNLKSSRYSYIVDVNRKGRKKPKFTLQLRSKNYKDYPLIRLDLIGPPHPNPEGDFPFSGEKIECPHMHIAKSGYGDNIAFPLNTEYAKLYLTDSEIEDLVIILKKFLETCNVGNISDIAYTHQTELI